MLRFAAGVAARNRSRGRHGDRSTGKGQADTFYKVAASVDKQKHRRSYIGWSVINHIAAASGAY